MINSCYSAPAISMKNIFRFTSMEKFCQMFRTWVIKIYHLSIEMMLPIFNPSSH